MVRSLLKATLTYCVVSNFVLAQSLSIINGIGFNIKIFILITFAILLILIFYAVHLYLINRTISTQKERLSKLSIDLKNQMLEKDKRTKDATLALEIISDNTFDAIIILNNLGRITFWNKAAERLFGYSEERVLNCDFIDIVIPKNKIKEFSLQYKFSSDRKINLNKQIFHITAVRKDGVEFPAELKISDVRKGDSWNTIGIIRNVSDSQTLERELILAEQQLLLSLQGANLNMWEWNLQTDEVVLSPTANELLGFDREEKRTTLKSILKSVHSSDLKKLQYEVEKHIFNKVKMVSVEYRVLTAYGSWNWIHTRGKVVEFDESKKPLRFIGVNSDINEQKIYEQELEKMNSKQIGQHNIN